MIALALALAHTLIALAHLNITEKMHRLHLWCAKFRERFQTCKFRFSVSFSLSRRVSTADRDSRYTIYLSRFEQSAVQTLWETGCSTKEIGKKCCCVLGKIRLDCILRKKSVEKYYPIKGDPGNIMKSRVQIFCLGA